VRQSRDFLAEKGHTSLGVIGARGMRDYSLGVTCCCKLMSNKVYGWEERPSSVRS
jgi:hypothetical protein